MNECMYDVAMDVLLNSFIVPRHWSALAVSHATEMTPLLLLLLTDFTATQYDRLLASSCCPSVCLSVTLCIVALRVGVHG